MARLPARRTSLVLALALLAASALVAAQPAERRLAAVHLYDNSRAYWEYYGFEDAVKGFPNLLQELLEPNLTPQRHALVRVGADKYQTEKVCEVAITRAEFGKSDAMSRLMNCRNKVFHAGPKDRAEMVGPITIAVATLRKAPEPAKLLMVYSTFYDRPPPEVLASVDLSGICVGVVHSLRNLVSAQTKEARKAEFARMQTWEQAMRDSGASGVYFLEGHSNWYKEIARKGIVDCLAGRT